MNNEEKTIGLLFKGANHIDHQKHLQVNDGQRLPLPGQDHSKPSVRQMFLNYNCQLQKGGAELISTQQRATCCQNVETSSKCSFCDRGLCLSCTTLCSRCYEVFCDRCSLTVYTENEDTIMCMNCCR
ncbi:uncharacterized protein [Anabrus simplex]|uniref:uncharacterized protein isoform X2 n=1 Tax=Anabrus simplex TaxID=316456 RepID=UPI0035A343C0